MLFAQKLLQESLTAVEALEALSPPELQALVERLEQQALDRRSE